MSSNISESAVTVHRVQPFQVRKVRKRSFFSRVFGGSRPSDVGASVENVIAERGLDKTNPHSAGAIKTWQQRWVIWWLRPQAPKQLKQEKQRLCDLWSGNPAAECATIFNRFKQWPPSDANPKEVADEVERDITVAASLLQQNFTSRYAHIYANRLVVKTTEVAEQLAGQYPEHATLILERLAQNDTQISQRFDEAIRDALSQVEADREVIRAHINQLRDNLPRLRELLTPGFFRKYSGILFGTGVTFVLHSLLPDWIKGFWVEYKTTQFARGIWNNFRSKVDQEFAESFGKALSVDLPALCEHLDAKVRESLSRVVDRYIDHKLKQQREILDVLLELSRAKCDVESGICWFRNAISTDTRSTLASWPGLFAGAGVLVFISAACAVWLYLPGATKAPATNPSPENKQVTAIAAKSEIDTASASLGNVTSTSADQPSPAPTAAITPETSTASGMLDPTELRPTEVTVAQKNIAIEQRQHQAVHSGSPPAGKYPFARHAERPGFYYSPYTGRVYDLRRVADGGLVRDPNTGQLFRRPAAITPETPTAIGEEDLATRRETEIPKKASSGTTNRKET